MKKLSPEGSDLRGNQQAGLAGPCQFVLLLNPYHAVKALHEKGWVQQEAYTTLFQRAQEIGATDLDEDDDEL